MNRIFPTWDEINSFHAPLTIGERALLVYLDKHLPKDLTYDAKKPLEEYRGWLIFCQPFLNGSRPDIAIFRPSVGLMIYEVKDWQLANYSFQHDEQGKLCMYVSDGRGQYKIKNPIDQVNYYREQIIGQLLPYIGEKIDGTKGAFSLIKTGLYFHNATTQQAKEKLSESVRRQNESDPFRYDPVIGHDSIEGNELSNVVPDVARTSSIFWKSEWNKEMLFWLKPPMHSIEQVSPLKISREQKWAATPQSGHHRLHGVVGSGKTHVIAYRAASLAQQGKSVLILTFTITLWHYIKDLLRRAPVEFNWGKIRFGYFHGFCKDILNELDVPWPSGDATEQEIEELFRATIPNLVLKSIISNDYMRYDAILIDEGQNFHIEWYKMLCQFLSSNDEILFVYDQKQNIFARETTWVNDVRGLRTKFRSDKKEFRTVYRLPLRVANAAKDFAQQFNLNKEVQIERVAQGSFPIVDGSLRAYSPHIIWDEVNPLYWKQAVQKAYNTLKDEEASPSDIVILLPDRFKGKECVEFFNEKNVEVNHVFEDGDERHSHKHKRAFWMGDGRLKMSTIHSFQGWEVFNVIVYIPERSRFSVEVLDALMYTALTRTRENLIILNTNPRYRDFGASLPKTWRDQSE